MLKKNGRYHSFLKEEIGYFSCNGKAGVYLVLPSAQLLKHYLGLGDRGRFSHKPTVKDDDRIRADYPCLGVGGGQGEDFLRRKSEHMFFRCFPRAVRLLDTARQHLKVQP